MVAISSGFKLSFNTLSSTIPTQLGRFTEMSSYFSLSSNSLSSTIPTQLGRWVKMATGFTLASNKLCSDVPTEVSALSTNVGSNWYVTTGNSIGTVCGWQSYMLDTRFPTMDGSTSTVSIDHTSGSKTGTLPSELGLLTELTQVSLGTNGFTGNGCETYLKFYFKKYSSSRHPRARVCHYEHPRSKH